MFKTIPDDENSRMYTYLLSPTLCGLIVPAEVEMAVRNGQLESVSVSKNCDKAVFKVKGRPTLFVPLKVRTVLLFDIFLDDNSNQFYAGSQH